MAPTRILEEGIRAAYEKRKFPWDFYFMAMAEADWRDYRADTPAAKSFYIRNTPFGGSYCVLGGITEALVTIDELDFSSEEFQEGAIRMGSSRPFVEFLASRKRLNIRVIGAQEGTVFFPHEPIVSVTGPLPDVRIAEGILTYALNFNSLSLTKWYRVVRAARPGQVLDFSLRRAQNSRKASLNAMLAGCSATSNCDIAEFFDVPVRGTMGHEWPMSYGDVKIAFDKWLEYQPNRPIGLVDTIQCLDHDFPAWLNAVYEHREKIKEADSPIWGWRNDSGDLGYLTVEQYRRFFNHQLAQDPWFRDRMRIINTNELDEYTITSIITQIRDDAEPAGLDVADIKRRIIWAAGTNPGVCNDQPSLGGVAKLMEIEDYATLKPALDAHGNPGAKTSIPGFNRSCLIPNGDKSIACVLIYPDRKYVVGGDGTFMHKPSEGITYWPPVNPIVAMHKDTATAKMEFDSCKVSPQQVILYESNGGKCWAQPPDAIEDVTKRINEGVDRLHFTMTSRLIKPHVMKVSVTPDLFELRQQMLTSKSLRVKLD